MLHEGALGLGTNLVFGFVTYLNCSFILQKIKSSNKLENDRLSRLKANLFYVILTVISRFAKQKYKSSLK
jgi:hypothetical protein